jgi:hypothetical protein
MFRNLIKVALILLVFSQIAEANWQNLFRVNTDVTRKQAPRDSDCPWSIAADESGNVYTVWEDKREASNKLAIYFRKKGYDGQWEQTDRRISEEVDAVSLLHGHPSICCLPSFYPTRLLICYVREDGNLIVPRELRGCDFSGTQWSTPSYYIGNSSSPNIQLGPTSSGWATNIVALSDGQSLAFWQYGTDNGLKLYFNKYNNGWNTALERPVCTPDIAYHRAFHENAVVDENDKVHLVYSSSISDQTFLEIYYLSKTTNQDDFGAYPGYQVSNQSGDTSAHFPYCTISEYKDTTFLNIVWSTNPKKHISFRSKNLITGNWSNIIDTIAPSSDIAHKPCIAADSYGNLHVVWQRDIGSSYVVRYRKFTKATGLWGGVSTLPSADLVENYGMPVIISDISDNLHVLMTGTRTGAQINDEEAYYSFYNAPPRLPLNLHQVFGYSNIHLFWSQNKEPDIDHYKVVRKYKTTTIVFDNIADTMFEDTNIPEYDPESGNLVYYWLFAIDNSSQGSPSSETLAVCMSPGFTPPKIFVDGEIPTKIGLSPNFPNPFNASTEIKYSLPFEHQVSITIFDILGHKIRTLVNENQQPGFKSVIWDGRNDAGNMVSSGIYLYRLSIADMVITKQMTLLK